MTLNKIHCQNVMLTSNSMCCQSSNRDITLFLQTSNFDKCNSATDFNIQNFQIQRRAINVVIIFAIQYFHK